jgi:hypothetical protein
VGEDPAEVQEAFPGIVLLSVDRRDQLVDGLRTVLLSQQVQSLQTVTVDDAAP